MNSNRSKQVRPSFLSSAKRMRTILAVAVACVGIGAGAHTALASSAACKPLTSIWLYETGGDVNVSSTFYVSGGNDYVVYEGDPIEITLDAYDGHVYDRDNNIIGYFEDGGPGGPG